MTPHLPPLAPPASTAVVILGADAVLAARPATPVQLAHACLAAGFRSAIPVTWGDELVAHECLGHLEARGPRPAIVCACPKVAECVLAPGAELSRFAVPLASPPVATARYLRALARETLLHLTFVGGCPSGGDPALDAHLTPVEFLAALAARGIEPAEQPLAFDSVLPPDRRRHYSLPGGIPTPEALARLSGGARRLVVVHEEDYATEVAEHLLSGEPVVIDLGPRLGCSCSGVTADVPAHSARRIVADQEPPRSPSPVVDPSVNVPVYEPRPTTPRATPVVMPESASPAGSPTPAPRPAAARPARPTPIATPAVGVASPPAPRRSAEVARPRSLTPVGGVGRRTPVSLPRVTVEHFPKARAGEGRLLPRAYVAQRSARPRFTPVGTPAVAAPTAGAPLVSAPEAPAAAPPGCPEEAYRPSVGVATPPHGSGYDAFVADVAAVVSREVEGWRVRLDAAIAAWRAHGYRTDVLERARALPYPPDMDGLLGTYAAAVEHLRRLEQLVTSVYPDVAGAAVLRDPERVEAAEAFVDRLFVGE